MFDMTLVGAFTILLASCSLALLLLAELLLQVVLPPLLHLSYSHWQAIAAVAATGAVVPLAHRFVLLALPAQRATRHVILQQVQGALAMLGGLAHITTVPIYHPLATAGRAEAEICADEGNRKGLGRCAVCLDAAATMGLTHKTGNVVHCCLCVGCAKALHKSGQLKQCVYCKEAVQQLVQVVAS